MQSTGHSSTQALSFTSMQGSAIVYVIVFPFSTVRTVQTLVYARAGGPQLSSEAPRARGRGRAGYPGSGARAPPPGPGTRSAGPHPPPGTRPGDGAPLGGYR